MLAAIETFSADVLQLDAEAEIARIVSWLRRMVGHEFRRKGAVLGLSGGIDSSVCAALCARAFGANRVLGVLMPERESASESLSLGQTVADHFGIPTVVEPIATMLEAAGCYARRDAAIRQLVPDFNAEWKCKLVLSSLFGESPYRLTSLVVHSPAGREQRLRLPLDTYQTIVAATNFKQRTRKMLEYFHADRLRYAVVGTPNRLEYELGFFVKNGDGAADVKPIAHLYKTQVYQLAEALDVPADIRRRPPTTDTFSLPQSQDEFYFALPYPELDLCLWADHHGVPADAVADATGLSIDDVFKVFEDIQAKRAVAEYLHAAPCWMGGEV
jgi:NAD+ synthase